MEQGQARCEVCGEVLTSINPQVKTCPPPKECRRKYRIMWKANYRKARAAGKRLPGDMAACETCGAFFERRRGRQTECPECRAWDDLSVVIEDVGHRCIECGGQAEWGYYCSSCRPIRETRLGEVEFGIIGGVV